MQKEKFTVAVIVGSLRAASLSLKMANFLCNQQYRLLALQIIPINDLSLYNEDRETAQLPRAWQKFRDCIREQDAVLFITPEYNRSVPAVLKNAVDIGSAPHGRNVFRNKPAAIISLSPGKMGAFGANHHLRQSLVFLDMPTLQQPEAYIGNSEALFTTAGTMTNGHTRDYLAGFMDAFADWISRHTQAKPGR